MLNLTQEDLSVTDWDTFLAGKQPRVARLIYVPKFDSKDCKLDSLPEHLTIVPFS